MSIFVQWAIQTVLKWAYSLTSEDLATAFKYVQTAQQKFSEATDKRKWVQEQLASVLGARGTGRAINFLIELAVAKLGNSR